MEVPSQSRNPLTDSTTATKEEFEMIDYKKLSNESIEEIFQAWTPADDPDTVYVRPDGSFHDGAQGVDFFGGEEETAWIGKKAAGRVLDGREWNEVPV
ncbi:MAG: hypothetical protein WAN92_09140 [Herbaspirillum sp.]